MNQLKLLYLQPDSNYPKIILDCKSNLLGKCMKQKWDTEVRREFQTLLCYIAMPGNPGKATHSPSVPL
jgi:hypothetical protein